MSEISDLAVTADHTHRIIVSFLFPCVLSSMEPPHHQEADTLSIHACHPSANHGMIQLSVKLQFQQLHGKYPPTLIEESQGREYLIL